MASATPIVATETEGAKELLKVENTGKLVPIETAAKLATAIEEFLNDENMRQTFGANAQSFAKTNFSFERMIDEIETVYQK